MDLSFFGYKLNVQILILIGIIYLILIGHTVCGCCNYGLIESFNRMKNGDDEEDNNDENHEKRKDGNNDISAPMKMNLAKNLKNNIQKKEGFSGMSVKYSESTPFDLNNDTTINTSSWFASDMTISSGKPVSDGAKKFLDRKQQQLPLKEGEMDFLANSEFKPECCPSTYSNSSGCWCGTSQDYNYLVMRGGNNVPYSEY